MAAIVPARGCSFARFTGGNIGANQSSRTDLRGFDSELRKNGNLLAFIGAEENHDAASAEVCQDEDIRPIQDDPDIL